MSYDGLLTKSITNELKNNLVGGKIEKISQPAQDKIVILIKTKESKYKLLIDISSSGSRVQLTKLEFENPLDAPSFCMLLRKHIQSGRISDIYQIDCQRIIVFVIETVNEMGYSCTKKLIAENMGKYSNIILLDAKDDKIIDSMKRISIDVNRYRQILPGLSYSLPPVSNLSNNLGYGPSTKESIELGASPLDYLPCVYVDDNNEVKDIHVIRLLQYENNFKKLCFDNIFDALDYYYQQKNDTNLVKQKANNFIKQLNSLIDKHNIKKAKLLDEIKQSDEADIYRIKAELLNCNLHLIQPGSKSIELVSYYDGNKIKIDLDEKISAAKNAQNYYKKYAKLKSSKKEKLAQLDICNEELEYLSTVRDQVSLSESISEIDSYRHELYKEGFIRINKVDNRNLKEKPKPRKFLLKSGKTVLVGRSNSENDYISFKIASKNDLWMHTKDIHGSHLLLQYNGEEISADDIYEAAAIAAYYSKGKDSDKVPVDYVPIRYLKKPAKARPGMVVFTNNKTVWVHPKNPNE